MKLCSHIKAIALLLAGAVLPAHGALTLRISDGINPPIEVEDNQTGDLIPVAGVIGFSGPVGAFSTTLTTGFSDPVTGASTTTPVIRVSSLATSGSAGQLTISLSDDNFGPTIEPKFLLRLSGAEVGSTVVFNAYVSPSNLRFAGDLLGSVGMTEEETVTYATLNAPYALTLETVITATAAQNQPSFTAEVITTQCPTVVCPKDIEIACEDSTDPSFTGAPTAACCIDSSSYVDVVTPGDCPQERIITRTWTVVTPCETTTCVQTITVVDKTAPVLAGVPDDVSVECDNIPAAAADVTATDSCDHGVINVVMTESMRPAPGECQSYILIRTWTATDACGNTATASQTITVVDTTAPVLQGVPADITVECDAVPAPPLVTAIDNCDPNPMVAYTESETAGSCPQSKVITRTWTATDRCGKSVSQTQTITVVDTKAPVLSGIPANVTVQCDAIPAPPANITALDNCDAGPAITFHETEIPGTCPQLKIITRTWTATDACGNSSSASQTITVEDTTAPTIVSQGPDLTIQCGAEPNFTPPTATDNCGPAPTITLVNDVTTPNADGGYTRTKTWQVADACGNAVTVSQSITVPGGVCEPGNFYLDQGGYGNSSKRTFVSGNGVTVEVTAFSRDDNGNWAPANIGQYSGSGLGVIDSSGNDSVSPHHAVDNVGRKNYLLFRFSEPVIASGAYLGWVSGDSDFSVRIGNLSSSTLDDAILAGFYAEENDTTASGERGATFNNGGVAGTALIIAASLTDSSPDDFFKLKKLDVCVPRCVPPPPPCVETKFNFSGNTWTDGDDGNVRTYTLNGITVKAYAFSRDKSSGAWSPSYLGAYSGGLGVTDATEGSGGDNMHTVDNIGRDNLVVFVFSQNVVVNRAYLGYVVDDSDLLIGVGTVPGAFSSAPNVSDGYFAGFALEQNLTSSSSERWASFNAAGTEGNVLVIGANMFDSYPNDRFKIEKVEICAPTAPPPPEDAKIGNFVWDDKNANGVQESGEPGVDGVKVELIRCSDNAVVATQTTSGGGLYLFTIPPDDYKLKFSNLPSGYSFSPANAGNDAADSDANPASGLTDCTTLSPGEDDRTWDAGINKPVPPPPVEECVPQTIYFTGSSSTDGYDGNIRTFSASGVSVKVSAFSRTSGGSWASAYLGVYSGGLGVTDSSEGDGSNNRHTVDNLDRNNYILFEFSEPVVVTRAFLGYVVNDSDLSVWVGNFSNPYNNHLTLSDSVLASFAHKENNDTTSSDVRWAEFNGGEILGNTLVIAASVSDSSPDDKFKIEKLNVCVPSPSNPCPSPWNTKDIGDVAKNGGVAYDSSTRKFTLKGSGADIWNSSDEFRYVYQQASGDCLIAVHVGSLENTDPWAKAGVMIRESLNANAKHASGFITPSNGVAFQFRDSTGGASGNENKTGYSAPEWIAIAREGNTFKCYRSNDGANWSLIGSKWINMGTTVYIGLAVTSHNDGALCTSTFSNVYVTP